MSKKNKGGKTPNSGKKPQVQAPVVEEKIESVKTEEIKQAPKDENPMSGFSEKVKQATANGLDPNHTTELLGLGAKYFHDTPDAAQRYNMPQNTVDMMDKCVAIGVVTLFAQEIALSNTPWSRTMRPAVLENMAEVAKEIGISIDLKALPAPNKNGTVTITDKNVKITADTKKKLKEEKELLEEAPVLDVDKIENRDQLKKSLLYFLSERTNYLANIQKAISLYAAFIEKEKSGATNGMTRIQLLHDMITFVEEAPLVINGIGSFLYSVTSATKSPISAFCHLRATVTDRDTGKCDIEDQFVADVVRELVIWKANILRKENERSIQMAEESLNTLKKDEKKNAEAIKKKEESIETLKNNADHFNKVISYITEPSSDVVEEFLEKRAEKDSSACRIFRTMKDSLYRGIELDKFTAKSILDNVKMRAGIITNLFRDPMAQFINYSEALLPVLVPVANGETTEEKAETEEQPKVEEEKVGQPKAEEPKAEETEESKN